MVLQPCPWRPSSVAPGVPATLSQISMSRGWGNMTGRRPGWSQNNRRAISQGISGVTGLRPPHHTVLVGPPALAVCCRLSQEKS